MARRKAKTSPFSGANVGAPTPAKPGRFNAVGNATASAPQRHKKGARLRHHRRRH